MNLYLFNDNNVASNYGIGTYLKELTRILECTDILVHIININSSRPEFEIVKSEKIEIWNVPVVRNTQLIDGAIYRLEDYYQNVIFLLRLHIKDTKDLVFHFNYNQCVMFAKGLKATFDCNTVTTVHYIKWAHELQGNLSKLHVIKSKPNNQRTQLELMLIATDEKERSLFMEVDRIITLSQYTKKLLLDEYQIGLYKLSFFPNGLADINAVSEISRNELRLKWHIPTNDLIILFVGRLNPVKGLTYLIRSFRKVLKIIPNCRLLVAGNGDYDIHIKEAKDICTKIAFTGLLEKKELYELYTIADIGVMPSFHEQCSYVAIEMMMHGVPLIASTSTGLKEMIEDGVSGFHIPIIEYPDKEIIDTDLLAEKMLYLLQNPKERERIGKHARKRYEQLYSLPVMRRNMLNFYNSLYDTENNTPDMGGT